MSIYSTLQDTYNPTKDFAPKFFFWTVFSERKKKLFEKRIEDYENYYLPSQFLLSFDYLVSNDVRIPLKRRIHVSAIRSKEGYTIEYDPLDIIVVEKSLPLAKMSFEEYLLSLMDNYLVCDKSELAPSGIILRNKLREYFYADIQ